MAWIKSYQNLKDHPKLLMLCQRTGKGKAEIIGYLHMFWWWVLDYAEDGDLSKFNGNLVVEGLKLQDLKDCGFIDADDKIHDWFDFSGRYLIDKYRTSNPKKLKSIEKKYSHDYRQTLVCKKSGQIDREIDRLRQIETDRERQIEEPKEKEKKEKKEKEISLSKFQESQKQGNGKKDLTEKEIPIVEDLIAEIGVDSTAQHLFKSGYSPESISEIMGKAGVKP